jgi:hypothetical protein
MSIGSTTAKAPSDIFSSGFPITSLLAGTLKLLALLPFARLFGSFVIEHVLRAN